MTLLPDHGSIRREFDQIYTFVFARSAATRQSTHRNIVWIAALRSQRRFNLINLGPKIEARA